MGLMIRRSILLGGLLVASLAWAQGVREAGMGGVSLPGPGQAVANPAFLAIEDGFRRPGWRLPLGALGLLLPDRSPLYYFTDRQVFFDRFDGLSFYDQFTHLDSFLINPETSPAEVRIEVKSDGVSVTDGAGHPLRLAYQDGGSGGHRPSPLLYLPFSLGQGLHLGLGAYAGVEKLGLEPDAKLAAVLAGTPLAANERYSVTASAHASSGLNLDFALALPLPAPKGRLYAGVRGAAFLGLARVDGALTATLTTDDQARPANSETATRIFYSYPQNGGLGYGLSLDVGLAYADEDAVYGVGLRDLFRYSHWSGTEVINAGGSQTERQTSRTELGFAPAVYLNAAGHAPAGPEKLLWALDLGFSGGFFGHAGVEYPLGPVALRGGLGYENGLRFGVGTGLDLGPVALDLALTSHTGIFSGKQVFGLAASVGF